MKNIEQLTDEQKSDLKYRFLTEWRDIIYTTKIDLEFNNWVNTQDPDYMDSVVIQCHKNNIPITGILLEQLKIAALNRLLRKYDYRKKTKVNQNLPYEEAYQNILRLIHFCGKSREDATLLVATMMEKYYPDHKKKASTLDHEYRVWRKDTGQMIVDYFMTEKPDGWSKEEQDHYLSLFPEPNAALEGSRRGRTPD